MSREQKMSWLIVGVFVFALAIFLLLIPLIGAKAARGALGLFGLAGLGPLLFRKKREPSEVDMDERDGMIAQKATMGAGIAAFEATVLVGMITWFVYYMLHGEELVSIHMLPFIVCVSGIVFGLVRAIAILVLYGREPRDG